MAGELAAWRMTASAGACAGEMRAPSPGRPASPAVRMVIGASPLFAVSVNAPLYTAPGARVIVSPGCAALMACWRSPPDGTGMVAARAGATATTAARHTIAETELVRMTLLKSPGGEEQLSSL